ncbi:MAG: hypothetical protein Q9206_001764 [Seirophora lacunosa]
MCQGEFESLKAMYAIVPTFIPELYEWGHLKSGPGYFLLAEFRQVGQQPPDAPRFTMRVAELHYNSKSPNGKFGFHVPTFHGNLPTYTDWEASWTVMYTKILGRAMDIDHFKSDPGPAFTAVRKLLFDYVIPRLLDLCQVRGEASSHAWCTEIYGTKTVQPTWQVVSRLPLTQVLSSPTMNMKLAIGDHQDID